MHQRIVAPTLRLSPDAWSTVRTAAPRRPLQVLHSASRCPWSPHVAAACTGPTWGSAPTCASSKLRAHDPQRKCECTLDATQDSFVIGENTPKPERPGHALGSETSTSRTHPAPILARICAKHGIVGKSRPLLAWILTMFGALCIARRDGGSSRGTRGSCVETKLQNATERVVESDVKKRQPVS